LLLLLGECGLPTATAAGLLLWKTEFRAAAHPLANDQERAANVAFLRPSMPSCPIPGTVGELCDRLSTETLRVRDEIEDLAVRRYGERGRGGHAWPYLETPPFWERQQLTANLLAKQQPRRILDIGPYFNPISSFINSSVFCPDEVVLVEPLLRPGYSRLPCGTKVTTAPATIRSFLEHSLAHTHYDAVICMGCDADFGPSAEMLETFSRPYTLYLEYSPSCKPSQKSYSRISEHSVLHRALHFPHLPAAVAAEPSAAYERSYDVFRYRA